MNLLFINYEFPPIGGGGANANYYLFKEFAKVNDLHVDLVTSSEKKTDYIEKFSENITIHRLNVRKKGLHFWTQREVLSFLRRSQGCVKKLRKEKGFDLCHAFFGFPSGYVAYKLRKELPYLVSLRGSDVPGFNDRFSLQYVFLKPLFKKIWRASRHVVANSRELKGLAEGTTPELPIKIIYNGIDTEEFSPVPRSQDNRANLLVVSRLIQRKGIDYLLKALPPLLEKYPRLKLTIAGEGNMKEDLIEMAASLGLAQNVSFLGRVEHDALPELYKNADIFVLPSFWEGMSNTLLEAVASGLPVVVTETGGTKELVKDNGIIIPKGDSGAITDALDRILGDKELGQKMAGLSREIALHFGWDKVARQYVDLYEETIA